MKSRIGESCKSYVALMMGFIVCACATAQSQSTAPQAQREKTATSAAASATNAAPPSSATDFASLEGKSLSFDQMLADLPRRVTSRKGTLGDMVNLLIIGTKQQVADAFNAAGWVQPDPNAEDAVVHAIEDTIKRTAYSQMPMSKLCLFGRSQDFGFAEGMPIQIVAERNHFRLWRAPWLDAKGQTVWAGAGTHDIGIERDSAGQLTHRIDPNVDNERAYILQTLQDAGKVDKSEYLTPKDPVKQALTATGDVYRSDGRILVIYLK
ncbi:MAG TPA: LssY C-terminal domain-containing protein [Candidatus Acidoferrales bacterium]|nr:LssY C-terminal domain-containing protein [Candidatus Acidoferrales bacterium]